MIHHLQIYGPKQKQLAKEYKNSVQNRFALMNIGTEWIFPVFLVECSIFLVGFLLGVPVAYISLFAGATLLWGYFLFAYMHAKLHVEGFWMEESWFFKKWFLRARKLHLIHHHRLDNVGRMNTNYGICFFFFDSIFGSLRKEFEAFNENGFKAAKKRYAYLFDDKNL